MAKAVLEVLAVGAIQLPDIEVMRGFGGASMRLVSRLCDGNLGTEKTVVRGVQRLREHSTLSKIRPSSGAVFTPS